MVDRDLRMCLTAGHLAEASEERRGKGWAGWGDGLQLQYVRSAPRPSSQTLSIAGSLARLINELFRLTLDL